MLLRALSWGKDMVAMSGSGPGYMQTIIITPYVHNMIYHVPQMMKKHGSLRKFSGQGIFINLYEQVYGTREIESPALQWYTIQMNTFFSKFWFSKLWLFKQKLSPHNIIQMPFWWICILWFILKCRDEKWWPASVFSAKEQSLGCSHQPSRSWKTPERTTRTRMGETRVWKKGWREASEKNLNSTTSSS